MTLSSQTTNKKTEIKEALIKFFTDSQMGEGEFITKEVAIQRMKNNCDVLAGQLVEIIFNWFNSSKKRVYSLHPENNSGYAGEQKSYSSDSCGLDF
jgi:hypothetical protein